MSRAPLTRPTDALRQRATLLAGGLGDLAQRASVYHHLYAHSGGNHTFPLLAAHGALWANGYFREGVRFAAAAAAAESFRGRDRTELVHKVEALANDLRDINRRVCIETYFVYFLTADEDLHADPLAVVPPRLREAMQRSHFARRKGRTLAEADRRDLFEAFFLWEQATIVGPAVAQAFARFDWPVVKRLALRPKIRFSYFEPQSPLAFRDFTSTEERVEMGMRAFDRACSTGWDRVETALLKYGVMPAAFGTDPSGYFGRLVQTCLERANGASFAPA